MDGLSEDNLIERSLAGQVEAYAELVRRFQERIYRTIYGMTRNHDDADDLAQETFLSAFRSLRSFRRKSSFFTWVYRIAVNMTLNFLKKKSREKGREDFAEDAPVHDRAEYAALSPEGDSLQKELRERIDEAVAGLPLPYRSAFALVVFQGLSHGRAADILGCSENTVSWRMHKARKMLQERLKTYLSS